MTPPTVDELTVFRNEDAFTEDESAYVDLVLQMATDAVWIFTGMDQDPVDTRLARIVHNAIMGLALWLMAQDEDREAINSPFSSERIGSYSYSKMQQAVEQGGNTGIYWLDLLMSALRRFDSPLEGAIMASSEKVFNPEGLTYEQTHRRRTRWTRIVDYVRQTPTSELLTGYGPPAENLVAPAGTEYMDLNSGSVYTIGGV